MLVCILGKCSEKYSTLCVWSNVKQNNNKKPTSKTTGIHQKWEPPLPATATHPEIHPATHHCQPPKPTQIPTKTSGSPLDERDPRSCGVAVQDWRGAKLWCCGARSGQCEAVVLWCEIGVRGGRFYSRSALGGCYSRSAPGWLLFEIGTDEGGGEWCCAMCKKEREREQERGKGGREAANFGKQFTNFLGVNRFPNFYI